MLISMKEMMNLVKPGEFAVGAFHALNLEQVQGILEAGVECRSPVIIALDEPAAMYAGLGAFFSFCKELAEDVPVPVSILLDHVHDIDLISLALAKGFSGILADCRGDHHGVAIEKLNKISELCQKSNAFFEIEVKDEKLKDEEIIRLVGNLRGDMNPDSLCVSIPGEDRDRPGQKIINLINDIIKSTKLKVSVSGAGSWPEEDIVNLINIGVWKISVGTRLNLAFTHGLKTYLDDNPGKISPRSYLASARDHLRDETINCIKSFKTLNCA